LEAFGERFAAPFGGAFEDLELLLPIVMFGQVVVEVLV